MSSDPGKRAALPVAQFSPPAYDGPAKDEILALRREYLNAGIITYYQDPLCVVAGHMQYVWDETGRQYLDAIGGIVTVSVGHCHPKVTERVREQVGRLVHTTTIYLHPTIVRFAQKLAEHMPADSDLKSSYFVNSGSEANDLAVLMARMHTGRDAVLAVRNGYHGGSSATMPLTAMSNWKYGVEAGLNVRFCSGGYCYRCPHGLTYPACDLHCAKSVKDVIDYETSGEVACFIAEPIQGIGGTVVPPPEYYRIVYDIVRARGGLCIADEVQCAWGRTGAQFWGFENWGVVPDMVTLAKGIANGFAAGACITRPAIAETLTRSHHFNTFGGNPIAMTAGLATLEVLDEENIQQRALEVGGYLKEKLLGLQERHALIGEVRGLGLMLGLELVKDRETKEHATAETAAVVEDAKNRGLLVGRGGVFGNVIRIKPPMCISKDDCDFLVECLDACFEAVPRR